MRIKNNVFCWLLCLIFLASGCDAQEKPEKLIKMESEVPPSQDTLTWMEHLIERGELWAATDQQHLNYRLEDGHPAGFQFELLDDFCEENDLRLNLLVNDSLEACYWMLLNGDIDLYAGTIDTTYFEEELFYRLAIETPKTLDESLAWVIPRFGNDSSLYFAIEAWLKDYQESDMRESFYRNYKGGKKPSPVVYDASHISPYDELIKKMAGEIGWDWRLIASIIYQESRFKEDLESPRGAYGPMQLMPVIMDYYDVDYDSSIEEHLEAGGKLLVSLDKGVSEFIADSLERQKFVLASYNAGLGGVMEARKKAEKKGKDPDLWDDNVELFTKRQTTLFVKNVLKRYSHYKALIE